MFENWLCISYSVHKYVSCIGSVFSDWMQLNEVSVSFAVWFIVTWTSQREIREMSHGLFGRGVTRAFWVKMKYIEANLYLGAKLTERWTVLKSDTSTLMHWTVLNTVDLWHLSIKDIDFSPPRIFNWPILKRNVDSLKADDHCFK